MKHFIFVVISKCKILFCRWIWRRWSTIQKVLFKFLQLLLSCRLSSLLSLNPTGNSKVWAWMRKSAAVWIKCISGLCPRKKIFRIETFSSLIPQIHIFCGKRHGFPFLAALWISLTCWLSWSSFQAGPNSKYAEISKHISDQKVECFQGQWDWCQFCKRKSNPRLMTRFISINGLQNLVENSDRDLLVKSNLFIDKLTWDKLN